MKVAAVQHDIAWEDAVATCARLEPLIGAAAAAGARLVVLTEMFATGFSLEAERVVEADGGPAATFLLGRAAAEGVWLGGSIATRPGRGRRPVNRFMLASPTGDVHAYDKIHPFTYAGEHESYEAGTEWLTVEVEGLAVTPFICYDLRFADEFWAVAQRTDCFLVPANWPAARRAHWTALLVARAVENQAYVVGVNRVGSGGGLDYAGDSRIVHPGGEVLCAAASVETVLVAEVDPAEVTAVRSQFPFLADRR